MNETVEPVEPYSNLIVPIQLGAQWLARAISWTRECGITRIEATRESMEWWTAENERAGKATVMYAEGKGGLRLVPQRRAGRPPAGAAGSRSSSRRLGQDRSSAASSAPGQGMSVSTSAV